MADQLYLSLWLNGFNQVNMLRHYEKLLTLFPVSVLTQGPSTLRILAVSYSEPALLERAFAPPLDVSEVLAAARDFQNADVCYRLETWWDIWQYGHDWKLAPAAVTLCCFGPEFEQDLGDDLRVELGIDAQFLPRPNGGESYVMMQSNIKSLLKLVHDAEEKLGVSRRQLWTESGENFAERLKSELPDAPRPRLI